MSRRFFVFVNAGQWQVSRFMYTRLFLLVRRSWHDIGNKGMQVTTKACPLNNKKGTNMKFGTLAITLLAASVATQAQLTGHVDLTSSYILRGGAVNPESSVPAVQWGVDYAHASGVYIGYWASSLTYDAATDPQEGSQFSTENDIYAGWSGAVGPATLKVGVTSYLYLPDQLTSTMGIEPLVAVSAAGATLMAQFNAKDVTYSNFGDTYITLAYTYAIDSTTSAGANLGWYVYGKDGKYIKETSLSESQGFRHVVLTLSKKVTPNITIATDAIIGGVDRVGADLGNGLVGRASIAF
jgi:uncharacterized protein (TIGR02001 family)